MARTSTRWSLSSDPSKRTRAFSTRPESTSSIAQPTAGDALTATSPSRQEADTYPPRVLIPRTSVVVPGDRLADGRLDDGPPDGLLVDGSRLDGLLVGSPEWLLLGLPEGLPVAEPVGAGDPVADPVEETTEPVETSAGSVKGSPTSPAAPKPTPTEAAANSAHRAPRATRLSTRRSSPGHP